MRIGSDNAIAWAQFQLRGGWRNVLTLVGAYCALMMVMAVLMINLSGQPPAAVMNILAGVILGLQAANLLFFANSRISAAIRKDVTGTMIESHRLMPISPTDAVIGYITGATAQSIAVGIASIVIGTFTAVAGNIALGRWIVPNLLLVLFAMFVWFTTAFIAFMSKGGAGLLWIVVIVLWLSQGHAALVLPGLTLLMTPIIGKTIFAMRADITWPLAVSVALQAALSSIFCVGAARKYARPDRSALGVLPGLLLLACWVLVSIIALVQWEEIRPAFLSMRRSMDLKTESQIVATLIVSMFLALVPLANAARDYTKWTLKHGSRDPALGRRPVPPESIALVAAILAALLPLFASDGGSHFVRGALQMGVIVLLFLLSMSYLLRWVYLAVNGGAMIAALWIAVTWLGPIFAELIHRAMVVTTYDETVGTILNVSPLGATLSVSGKPETILYQAFAWQAALILIPATLYYTNLRSKKALTLLAAG